jgi:hypothetical protein
MGTKRTGVNLEQETAVESCKPRKLGVKEEKFCVQFVMTDDRHLSYERAGYLAKDRNVQSAAITRLLKQPKIQTRIEEITTEMLLAQGVTRERVTANLAEIGFNKANTKADRNTALRTLAQSLGMLSDTVNINDLALQRELDSREAEECRQIALIRLKMQLEGETHTIEGVTNSTNSSREAEALPGIQEGNESNAQSNGFGNGNAPDSNGNAGYSVTAQDDDDARGSEGTSTGELRPAGLPVSALPEQPGGRGQDDTESRGIQEGRPVGQE